MEMVSPRKNLPQQDLPFPSIKAGRIAVTAVKSWRRNEETSEFQVENSCDCARGDCSFAVYQDLTNQVTTEERFLLRRSCNRKRQEYRCDSRKRENSRPWDVVPRPLSSIFWLYR